MTQVAKAAKAASTAVSVVDQMMEQDAGAGFEGAGVESYAIPFLSVLQSGSPQCKKSEGAYIKGAEEGMLYNSVTQEVFNGEEGVLLVPCAYKRAFLKWAPRDSGRGFMGEFLASSAEVTAAAGNGYEDDEGNHYADTRTHYCLLLAKDGSASPAVLSLSSTQIKKSRQWMTRMTNISAKRADGSSFTPPMFSHIYRLTTVPESNDKGSWMGVKLELVGPVTDAALYTKAKGFRDAVQAGTVKEQVPVDDYADRDGEF